VNPADAQHTLHVLLAGSALAVGLLSDRDHRTERGQGTDVRSECRGATATPRAADGAPRARDRAL
jgi:hypothetical protein